MKKGLKIGLLILGIAGLSSLLFIKPGESKTKSYYSGDAINYNGQIIVSTADTGSLEVFKVSGQEMLKVIKLRPFDPTYGQYKDFSDAKLSIEGGRLYIYAVSEYSLYKYDISDLASAQLVKKTRNTYWEWYYRVDKFGDQIVTVGNQSLKVWSQDLVSLDSYNFKPSNRYSLRANNSSQFIFALDGSRMQIFDRATRNLIKDFPVNYSNLDNNHKMYYDLIRNEIYIADDVYTKKLDFSGNLLGSFRHLDQTGYDVDSTLGNDFLYFSNGYGVVKLRKDDMKVAAYAYTTKLGQVGGWAMGLKIVNSDAGDRVIVFNNSSILVMDQNLKKIASVAAQEEETSAPQENLYLILDHNIGVAGSVITLTGGGFYPQEPISIDFAGTPTQAQANGNGRFIQNLTVPSNKTGWVDIKVTGQNSGLTYSTSFKIQ